MNWLEAETITASSLTECEQKCADTPSCTNGYFWAGGDSCYLYGTADATGATCTGIGVNEHDDASTKPSTIFVCRECAEEAGNLYCENWSDGEVVTASSMTECEQKCMETSGCAN